MLDYMTEADFHTTAEDEEMRATLAGDTFELWTDEDYTKMCDEVATDWVAVINACGCRSPLCGCFTGGH